MPYTIGIDYGTLSARAVLIDTDNGNEIASSVCEYAHGVMDTEYRGTKLPINFALQEVNDYIDVLVATVREVAKGIDPADIVGIGLDFTAATVLPIDSDGTPLSNLPEFADNPHAATKLWKHHGATDQAERIAAALEKYDPERLKLYGGKISSEWTLPKILETLECAPEIYFAADRFIEAGDYITMLLCGRETRSIAGAGYKAMYTGTYPSDELLASLDERLVGLYGTKITTDVVLPGECVGTLTPEMAERLGLSTETKVAAALIDAHAAIPGCGLCENGDLLLIVGTSNVQMILADELVQVDGMCGVVKDGFMPGKYCYESGQAAVGDSFDWFVKNCVPERYALEARERGIGIHNLLTEKAAKLKPGQSRLLALDWLNGARSPYQDQTLTGLIVGLNLATKPEEIYRALLESTAYGTRQIVDKFAEGGIVIDRVIAAGGIAAKNPLMMQIYADVLGRPITLGESTQAGALGSAIGAAVASGIYPDLPSGARAMGRVRDLTYTPDPESVALYDRLYELRNELADRFASDKLMKRLTDIGDN